MPDLFVGSFLFGPMCASIAAAGYEVKFIEQYVVFGLLALGFAFISFVAAIIGPGARWLRLYGVISTIAGGILVYGVYEGWADWSVEWGVLATGGHFFISWLLHRRYRYRHLWFGSE